MLFTSLTDPVDGSRRWYWRFTDEVRGERIWHGPFASEALAKADAAHCNNSWIKAYWQDWR